MLARNSLVTRLTLEKFGKTESGEGSCNFSCRPTSHMSAQVPRRQFEGEWENSS
jgi:hypothetical protein